MLVDVPLILSKRSDQLDASSSLRLLLGHSEFMQDYRAGLRCPIWRSCRIHQAESWKLMVTMPPPWPLHAAAVLDALPRADAPPTRRWLNRRDAAAR